MHNYSKEEALSLINKYALNQTPFIFIIDFEMQNNHVITLDAVDPDEIKYNFNGVTNSKDDVISEINNDIKWEISPVSFDEYKKSFDYVLKKINRGDSFLVNLTCKTKISTNLSLKDIFINSRAKYKLYIKNKFCSLSPESFIILNDNKISCYPMKGTIDASINDAKSKILNNKKETAEHATIVDLIRNDLSIYAHDVKVERYRYTDLLHTNKGDILQVSSQISGMVKDEKSTNLGELIFSMLPAGSISGAPKRKTLEIIKSAENRQRGYYTGVAGIFDGKNLDSSVLIRSIEIDQNNDMYFHSGGGITFKSNINEEYEEMLQKIYLPITKCKNTITK